VEKSGLCLSFEMLYFNCILILFLCTDFGDLTASNLFHIQLHASVSTDLQC